MTKQTTKQLVAPIEPVKPSDTEEAKNALNMAMAAAITAATKVKGVIVTNSNVSDWREPEASLSFKYKPTIEEWKEYNKAAIKYNEDKRLYDDTIAASEANVSLPVYQEAKRKLSEYNQKKCATAPEHDIQYFLNKLTITEIKDPEQPMISESSGDY